jgi:hypothetical protein
MIPAKRNHVKSITNQDKNVCQNDDEMKAK